MENTHKGFGGDFKGNISITADENGVVTGDMSQTPEAIVRAAEGYTKPVPQEKILGKFETQADLEKAYKELESKLGSNNDTDNTLEDGDRTDGETEEAGLPSDELDTDEVDETEEDAESDSPDLDEVDAPLSAKESVDEAFYSLAQAGEMTEDVQKQFDKVGISKELVDQFSELLHFKAEAELKEQQGIAGGAEGYKSLITWASTNLSDAEITAFDKTMDEGSNFDITNAITNLKARMDVKVTPKKRNLIKAEVARGASVYSSVEQFHRDQQDPRWDTNPDYQRLVIAKMQRSKLNG